MHPTTQHYLGIDVGGSSVKAAVVDVSSGQLCSAVSRWETPHPATPDALIAGFATLAQTLPAADRIGLAMPCVVQQGVTRTAANIDTGWIDFAAAQVVQQRLQRPVTLVNDADAAGLAEMHWGAGRGQQGVVMLLTFGTGIGSALFHNGVLIPNTELGHLQLDGYEAEHRASARVRTEEHLDWPAWTQRVNAYLAHVHALFWPDLFILGGAVSEHFALFEPWLRCRAPVRAAQFTGQAGIVGAALAAQLDAG